MGSDHRPRSYQERALPLSQAPSSSYFTSLDSETQSLYNIPTFKVCLLMEYILNTFTKSNGLSVA